MRIEAYRATFGTDDKQLLLLLLQMSMLSDSRLLVHVYDILRRHPMCSCCQGFCPWLAFLHQILADWLARLHKQNIGAPEPLHKLLRPMSQPNSGHQPYAPFLAVKMLPEPVSAGCTNIVDLVSTMFESLFLPGQKMYYNIRATSGRSELG